MVTKATGTASTAASSVFRTVEKSSASVLVTTKANIARQHKGCAKFQIANGFAETEPGKEEWGRHTDAPTHFFHPTSHITTPPERGAEATTLYP